MQTDALGGNRTVRTQDISDPGPKCLGSELSWVRSVR